MQKPKRQSTTTQPLQGCSSSSVNQGRSSKTVDGTPSPSTLPYVRTKVGTEGGSSDDGSKSPLLRGEERTVKPSSANDITNKNGKEYHDPYGVFQQKLKEHFEEDYVAGNWMPSNPCGSGSKDFGNIHVVQATTRGDPNDPHTIVSMTTCTRKEKRPDKSDMYEIKTVTKVLKLNGSVQKFSQASLVDEEIFHLVRAGTITITREHTLPSPRGKK